MFYFLSFVRAPLKQKNATVLLLVFHTKTAFPLKKMLNKNSIEVARLVLFLLLRNATLLWNTGLIQKI
jgi:hypothetical protein